MQRLEVSGAVRCIYRSLGFKGLSKFYVKGVFKIHNSCGWTWDNPHAICKHEYCFEWPCHGNRHEPSSAA